MKLLLVLAAFSVFAAAEDPWPAQQIVPPKALAERLQAKEQPPIYYVGFPTLYRNGAHILGASLAGPCSKVEGVDALRKAVADLPRDKELFIYCGCCPFVKCPNIRPAYSALHDMGFSNVKVVMIESNLHSDWIEKGYPSEKTSP
jgi:thiosulfate/3-mercaptopyruvate sulfurtransferase